MSMIFSHTSAGICRAGGTQCPPSSFFVNTSCMTDKRAAFVGCGLNEGEGKPVEGGLPVSLVIAPRSNARALGRLSMRFVSFNYVCPCSFARIEAALHA